MTSLLHESLAQEDAVDPFDGVFYSTATGASMAMSTGSLSTACSDQATFSMSDSGISSFPSSVSSGSSLSPSPSSIISGGGGSSAGAASPEQVNNPSNSTNLVQQQQQHQQQQTTKFFVILPPGTTTQSNNNCVTVTQQPLDFAQVFGKLSNSVPTTSNAATTTSSLLNGAMMVNELFQGKGTTTVFSKIGGAGDPVLSSTATTAEQLRRENGLTCGSIVGGVGDSQVIKIDPGNIKQLPSEIHNENSNGFQLTFKTINDQASSSTTTTASGTNGTIQILTTSTDNNQPQTHVLTTPTHLQAAINNSSKLKDILLETSRESMMDIEARSENSRSAEPEVITPDKNREHERDPDPMLILSQAVNLQKVPILHLNSNFNLITLSKCLKINKIGRSYFRTFLYFSVFL